MKLSYKAVSSHGEMVKGVIEAKDAREAVMFLRKKNFLPVSVAEEKTIDFLKFISRGRFKNSDLVFFTRQLSSMISSGLTLMQALNILKDQVSNLTVKDTVANIASDIEGGLSFSSALLRHPNVFSPIYISLIKSAEGAGLLDKVLLRLSDNLEKEQNLRGKIKGALMYPFIVVVVMIAAIFIMMIFVIPQLSSLYQGLNLSLPLPTLILVRVSQFFVLFWPLMIGGFFLLFYLYKKWAKTEAGKLIIDDIKLRIPIFGKLNREITLTELTRTLGILVGSGSLFVEALQQVYSVIDNSLYKNAVSDVVQRIEKGLTIGDSFMYSPLFPPIMVQMVRIGEETGKLDESLMRVSEYFEKEVDQTVKTLMVALEPLIMLFLGLGVAFFIISIITPIYSITSSIK